MIPRTSNGQGHRECYDGEQREGGILQRLAQEVSKMRVAVMTAAALAVVTVVVIVLIADRNKLLHPHIPADGKSKQIYNVPTMIFFIKAN